MRAPARFFGFLVLFLLLAGGLLAGARPANAQLPASGDWVRVQVPGGMVVGRLERIDGDSVVLVQAGAGPRLAAARSQVSRLWVSTGESRNTWRGMRTGALALGAFGALLGAATGEGECQGMVCVSPAEGAAILGGMGVVAGAAAGALLGSFTFHHDWGAVELPPVGIAPHAAGGVALSLRLRL